MHRSLLTFLSEVWLSLRRFSQDSPTVSATFTKFKHVDRQQDRSLNLLPLTQHLPYYSPLYIALIGWITSCSPT
jgi:hypothetical protein